MARVAEVPQSAEERSAVRSGLHRLLKAELVAGRLIEGERLQLELLNFSWRCQLHDAKLDKNTPPEELSELEEAVRSSSAGLKSLAAAAAAAGER